MLSRRLLPYGVKDYYPAEALRLGALLAKAERILTLWGYSEIKLPLLEYKSLFEETLGEVDGIFTLPEYGRELALRYDFTPQLLRFVLHQKRKLFPLRLYYKGETFNRNRQLWEEPAVGFELVGGEGSEADAEVLVLTAELLKEFGIEGVTLVVGHRTVYDRLSERFGTEAVNLKRYSREFEPYLRTYELTSDGWEELDLPGKAKEELRRLGKMLKNYGVRAVLLPSLAPEREYYSGIFFKALAPSGKVLGGGGRYDRLFERFGHAIPAAGATLLIGKLLEEVNPTALLPVRIYAVEAGAPEGRGWELAKLLRERGFAVARDTVPRNFEKSLEVAKEKGYDLLLAVGKDLPPGGTEVQTSFGRVGLFPLTERGKRELEDLLRVLR
ncbi:MAG: hypothetical protein GXO08_01885 [Aquificae bacterium]|nr:hypothetical protein [Aquificota bacterium]